VQLTFQHISNKQNTRSEFPGTACGHIS